MERSKTVMTNEIEKNMDLATVVEALSKRVDELNERVAALESRPAQRKRKATAAPAASATNANATATAAGANAGSSGSAAATGAAAPENGGAAPAAAAAAAPSRNKRAKVAQDGEKTNSQTKASQSDNQLYTEAINMSQNLFDAWVSKYGVDNVPGYKKLRSYALHHLKIQSREVEELWKPILKAVDQPENVPADFSTSGPGSVWIDRLHSRLKNRVREWKQQANAPDNKAALAQKKVKKPDDGTGKPKPKPKGKGKADAKKDAKKDAAKDDKAKDKEPAKEDDTVKPTAVVDAIDPTLITVATGPTPPAAAAGPAK